MASIVRQPVSLLKDPEDVRVRDLRPYVPLLGVPWDWSTAGRPGARFAPAAIREELLSMRPLSHEYGTMEVGFDDLGDVNVVGGDFKETSRRAVEAASKALELARSRRVPMVVLGGDHSVTGWTSLPAVSSGAVLVVLDAHYDMRRVSEGVTSGSWLRELAESVRGLRAMVIGVADYANPPYAPSRAEQLGIEVVPRSALLESSESSLEEISGFVRGREVYLSIDIDHIDQAFAPGVNSPTPLGMTPYESLRVIRAVASSASALVGVDVVEVVPYLDPTGGTARLAASLILSAVHVSLRGMKDNGTALQGQAPHA